MLLLPLPRPIGTLTLPSLVALVALSLTLAGCARDSARDKISTPMHDALINSVSESSSRTVNPMPQDVGSKLWRGLTEPLPRVSWYGPKEWHLRSFISADGLIPAHEPGTLFFVPPEGTPLTGFGLSNEKS